MFKCYQKTLPYLILLMFSSGALSNEITMEKTEWGEIPSKYTMKIDEQSNGAASAIFISKKCSNMNKSITLNSQFISKVNLITPEPYKNACFNYAKAAVNLKLKVFNEIYKDKKCSEMNGLYEIATVNNYEIK